MEIQTQQVAVICTSHVSAMDTQVIIKLLKEGSLTGMDLGGGWLLSTAPLGEVAELAVPMLKPLVECFAEKGFDWVIFDRNADEVDGLPVYAW